MGKALQQQSIVQGRLRFLPSLRRFRLQTVTGANMFDEQLRSGGQAKYVPANLTINNYKAACLVDTATGKGSGCLVNGRIANLPATCILTNNHVISDAQEARTSQAIFNKEEGQAWITVKLDPDAGFYTYRGGDLDFTI